MGFDIWLLTRDSKTVGNSRTTLILFTISYEGNKNVSCSNRFSPGTTNFEILPCGQMTIFILCKLFIFPQLGIPRCHLALSHVARLLANEMYKGCDSQGIVKYLNLSHEWNLGKISYGHHTYDRRTPNHSTFDVMVRSSGKRSANINNLFSCANKQIKLILP